MKKFDKKDLIILASVAVVVSLVTMMMISHYSPLHIQAFRLSIFGDIWQVIILPVLYITFWPMLLFYEVILCQLAPNKCYGIMDGGPLDPCFFTIWSGVIGILYGAIAVGIRKLIKRIKK